ncbi:HlyD family type I secretion periplasmic adaptor subunit [soil metagenome]
MSEGRSVLEDIPDRIKPETASSMLLWVVVAMVVALFGWAGLTKIDRTVRGQGKVIPSSQLQTVSNLEGGVVAEIMVRAGETVDAGQPIIRLDETQSRGELGSGEASTDALSAKIARLRAEVMGQEPRYPVSTAASVQNQILIERALHASRMADLGNLVASAQARQSQAQHSIGEAEANYRSRVAQRDSRSEEARILRPLVEHGVEPRMSLIQAESAAASAASDAESASAAIARARSSAVEASASVAAVRQNWRAAAAEELATAQAELSSRSAGLPALARRVDRTVVRAPVQGRVNRVLVSTPGSAISPGQPLVEIVPSNDTLLIEAAFKPADIGFIHLGQNARISVTAYDRSIYGLLDGKVESISPDTVEKEKGGESYYIVHVRTTANELQDVNGRLRPIGPGMIAEVDVLGEKRSVLDYILSPITQIREDAFGDK